MTVEANFPTNPSLVPAHGGESMEHRVTALETRLDTILPTLATKADIGSLRGEMHELNVGAPGQS